MDDKGANDGFLMDGVRSLSRDGRITVFATDSSNIVPGDTNDRGDVFTYNRITKKTEIITRTPGGIIDLLETSR